LCLKLLLQFLNNLNAFLLLVILPVAKRDLGNTHIHILNFCDSSILGLYVFTVIHDNQMNYGYIGRSDEYIVIFTTIPFITINKTLCGADGCDEDSVCTLHSL